MQFNAQTDDPLDEIRQILEEQGKLLASIEKRLPPLPPNASDDDP